MRSNIIHLFVLCISLLALSCKQTSVPVQSLPPPPTGIKQPDVLVPLAIGNSWTFIVTDFNLKNEVSWRDTVVETIISDTLLYPWQEKWYRSSRLGFGYRNSNHGFHELAFDGWEQLYIYPDSVRDTLNLRAISTDTVVQTPLGSLHCYWYQTRWVGIFQNHLFAPGIGPVHREWAMGPFDGPAQIYETWDLIATNVSLRRSHLSR